MHYIRKIHRANKLRFEKKKKSWEVLSVLLVEQSQNKGMKDQTTIQKATLLFFYLALVFWLLTIWKVALTCVKSRLTWASQASE